MSAAPDFPLGRPPVRWEATWVARPPVVGPGPAGMLVADGVAGYLLPGDLLFLQDFARGLPPGGTLVEIGSFLGLSSVLMASALLAEGNFQARLYCIDTWEGSPEMAHLPVIQHGQMYATFCDNVQRAQVAPLIVPLRDRSTDVAPRFPDASVDRLFLDGDHSEAGCYADLVAWVPKLKPGGRFIGHDCTPDGGVRPALDRFCAERGLAYDLHEPPAGHYLFELKGLP